MRNSLQPYYEIAPIVDGKAQIIIEMPGITDVRQVNWKKKRDKIEFSARTEDVQYRTIILLPKKAKLQSVFSEIKNGVFILPFKV